MIPDAPTFHRFYAQCGKTDGSGFSAFDASTGEQTDRAIFNEILTSRDRKTVGIARRDTRICLQRTLRNAFSLTDMSFGMSYWKVEFV